MNEDEDFDIMGGTAATSDGKPRPNRRKKKEKAPDPFSSDASAVAQDQLRSYVERIERLEEEKKTVAEDIKDVYAEAKGQGFDTKVLRKTIALRKMDPNERAEQDAILDLYLEALGMTAAELR